MKKLSLAILLLMGFAKPALAHIFWSPSTSGQTSHPLWLAEFAEAESIVYDLKGLTDGQSNTANITTYDTSGNIIASDVYDANGTIFSSVDLSGNPIDIYDINGNLITPADGTKQSPVTVVPSQVNLGAISATFDGGYWAQDLSMGMDTEHNPSDYLGFLTPAQQQAYGYSNIVQELKFTQALYNGFSPKVNNSSFFNLPLEVVPLANPFELSAGSYLPIEISLYGKTVSGNDPNLEILAGYNGDPISSEPGSNIFQIPIESFGLAPLEVDYAYQRGADQVEVFLSTSLTAFVPESSQLPAAVLTATTVVLFNRYRKRQ